MIYDVLVKRTVTFVTHVTVEAEDRSSAATIAERSLPAMVVSVNGDWESESHGWPIVFEVSPVEED